MHLPDIQYIAKTSFDAKNMMSIDVDAPSKVAIVGLLGELHGCFVQYCLPSDIVVSTGVV